MRSNFWLTARGVSIRRKEGNRELARVQLGVGSWLDAVPGLGVGVAREDDIGVADEVGEVCWGSARGSVEMQARHSHHPAPATATPTVT